MKPGSVAVALVLTCLLIHTGSFATAQEPAPKPRPQAKQQAASPQPPPQVNQVALTDKKIEGFIAAQKEVAAITKTIKTPPTAKIDPKIGAQLDSVATKYGFKGFGEYEDVAATIAMIMAGIDPVTKTFLQPRDAIQQEIAEVTADKEISKAEKTKMLQDLKQALRSAQPIQHPGNIDLVKSYFDKIEAAVQ